MSLDPDLKVKMEIAHDVALHMSKCGGAQTGVQHIADRSWEIACALVDRAEKEQALQHPTIEDAWLYGTYLMAIDLAVATSHGSGSPNEIVTHAWGVAAALTAHAKSSV